MNPKKSNKICDIVRLQQILKKWRKLASSSGTGAGKSNRFLKSTVSETSANVAPKGYVAVTVGEEMKRFVIPTQYLGHPAVKILLRESAEEFGFQQTGVLRLPCEVSLFENVLKIVEKKKKDGELGGDDYDVFGYCSSELESHRLLTPAHQSQSSMCR